MRLNTVFEQQIARWGCSGDGKQEESADDVVGSCWIYLGGRSYASKLQWEWEMPRPALASGTSDGEIATEVR